MNRILTGAVGLALLTAACGGDGDEPEAAPTVVIDGESAASDSADGTAGADGTDEELALEFAQCMRDNGVPQFEDPTVDADGSIQLAPGGVGGGGNGDLDPGDPDVQAAIEACGDIIAGASFLPGADLDEAELEDDLLAMAQCLRDLGHDVTDPDLSGGFGPGAGGGGGPQAIFGPDFDPTDPANGDDVETCQETVYGPDGPAGLGQRGGN